jgi:hypothetical protein
VAASRVETPRTPHGTTEGVTRAAPHGHLALSRRKFHATWDLAAQDLARSDTDRHRVAVRWVRLVGARPRSVADCLRVREAYEFERVRRDPYLSCARLCLTVRKARVQMRAESIHDVTSIKVQRGSSLTSSLSSLLCPQSAPPQHGGFCPHERRSCGA